MKDSLKIKGYVEVFTEDEEDSGDNLIVSSGKDIIRNLINNEGTKASHIAVGLSGDAVAVNQGSLVDEKAREGIIEEKKTAGRITYETRFTGGWTGIIREVGLFNSGQIALGGSMISRYVLGVAQKKQSGAFVIVRWTLEID